MTAFPSDFANTEPFDIIERPEHPQTDPTRAEITLHPAPTKTSEAIDLAHNRWIVDISDEHRNDQWDEWFEVLAGEVRVVHDGTETTLTEGEDIVLPAGGPHRHWNPTGQPARIRYEARPGLRSAEVLETIYALAQMGKTDENGLPNLIQFAVIQDAYPAYIYSTALPKSIQRAMIAVLSPIGRLLGYKATYSRDEIAELAE